MQRYHDSLVESGMSIGAVGCETFDDWLQRGPVYHFDFTNDRMNNSSQLQIMSKFGALPAGSLLYVASWYSREISITTNQGVVTRVEMVQAAK